MNCLDFIWLSDTYDSYWPKQKILSTKLTWAANNVYIGFERDIEVLCTTISYNQTHLSSRFFKLLAYSEKSYMLTKLHLIGDFKH